MPKVAVRSTCATQQPLLRGLFCACSHAPGEPDLVVVSANDGVEYAFVPNPRERKPEADGEVRFNSPIHVVVV